MKKKPTKIIKIATVKKDNFNKMLPKKIFKKTKIKNLYPTNRTFYV